MTEAVYRTTNPTLTHNDKAIPACDVNGRLITVSTDATGAAFVAGTDYETVAASQTDQVLGATGAIGDLLAGLLIIPATTSAGAVSIKDGSGSAITVFTGGATSVGSLVPFPANFGVKCTGAGWKVTTGANVSVFAFGEFT